MAEFQDDFIILCVFEISLFLKASKKNKNLKLTKKKLRINNKKSRDLTYSLINIPDKEF
jgi:hypothetical protein